MFWYFPIESYEERYSCYLSTPNGFWETFLTENAIKYTALRPMDIDPVDATDRIRPGAGCVLDSTRRCRWAMAQVRMFLNAIDNGEVKDGDVVYCEDFWHPGFESLPYVRDMYKLKFKIYAWCHADSWDDTDFTHYMGMTPWKRFFDRGIASCLEGIFVADAGLKELILDALHGARLAPIHAVGTCWNTEWILNTYGARRKVLRRNVVVFASRFDADKNPDFYMDLASSVLDNIGEEVQFIITTGHKELVSNKSGVVDRARNYVKHYGEERFAIYENLTKAGYFEVLRNAKVHFNCASHDWISYALCESVTFGAMPLFPDYRSFPLALQFDLEHLYKPGDLDDAKRKLMALLDEDKQKDMSHILRRMDATIPYVAHTLGIIP